MQIRRDYSVRGFECNQKAGFDAFVVGRTQLSL